MAKFNVSTPKSQENNQFFMAFKDSGFSPTLILPAILLCLIASAGICLNSFVVFVTIKTKTLHNPTNFLLAFLSSFEILHQIGHFPFLFIVITGINFVPILTAFWILLIPLFSLNAALMAMTCTALDRVVAILADIIREKMGILAYMGLHLALIALYGLHSCQYFYKFVMDNSFVWVTGCITEMMIGESGKIFFVHTAALCSIASICYLVVWIFVRTKSFASHETHSRLFKSLVIILLVNIGGYIVNLFFLQVLLFILETEYSADQTHLWLISFISAFLMNGCVASNAFILYSNSSDYRSAFKKYLEIICAFRHKSMVNPLISVSHPQNNSRTLPQIQ